MVGEVTDNDVHISLDDQKMINRFARQNQKLEEIKDELKTASTEIDTLEDCSADVEELALTAEEGVTIPYMVGELFVLEEPDQVQTLLEERKASVQEKMKVLEGEAATVRDAMADLRTHLYAKFGEAINLEADQ
eukprot:TRINITY_DN6778_c0_g1_i1.p1 TRINITY_DN6778_c0_g1~~TRINITY_DN6778_c0_g1_i1.p1  ORF type:complete len:134 (-),score=67.42 TRINITY_DN6778_c0_g1_i1:30-431(-)